MKSLLWRWYRYAFIRTPFMAFSLMIVLIFGMVSLMNGIEIRLYESAVGIPENHSESDKHYLTVFLQAKRLDVKENDDVLWHTGEDDNRYTAKVSSIEAVDQGFSVKVHVEEEEWNRVYPVLSAEQKDYVVDIPIGRQTVMERLFRKGEAENGE